ncbi:hypothetical protein CCACVL1_16083 [Corchorus capsularis]|uniref:Uncharacterized protein n=1 Tax=Corchorus capsularis TaxID=210143 RepID=A0A1R3HZC3_COCAP|nr:hypothetical protein CCACVL1_16083 [Corchorus capsularis]
MEAINSKGNPTEKGTSRSQGEDSKKGLYLSWLLSWYIQPESDDFSHG